jgi:hypothetical protein
VKEKVSAPKGIDAGIGGHGTETVLLVEDEEGVRGLEWRPNRLLPAGKVQ